MFRQIVQAEACMCLSACMHGKRWVSVMMAVVDSFRQAWKRVGQCNDGDL